MVKFHVGPDEVGNDIAERRLQREIPEHRVLVLRARDAAQARVFGGVTTFDVEDLVGFGHLAALHDETIGRSAQLRQPFARDCAFDCQIAVLEIRVTLRLRDGLDGVLFNVFGCPVEFLSRPVGYSVEVIAQWPR